MSHGSVDTENNAHEEVTTSINTIILTVEAYGKALNKANTLEDLTQSVFESFQSSLSANEDELYKIYSTRTSAIDSMNVENVYEILSRTSMFIRKAERFINSFSLCATSKEQKKVDKLPTAALEIAIHLNKTIIQEAGAVVNHINHMCILCIIM